MTDAKTFSAKSVARWAGALAIFVGGMVLVGWALDVAALKSILPGWVSVKPNTALAFVLTGIALLVSGQRAAWLARLCGWLAGLIGLLTLGEYVFGWNPGFDQWLFREAAGTVGTSYPGRMAPDSALCFVMLAAGLAATRALGQRNRMLTGAVILGALVMTMAVAAITTYFTPAFGAFGWGGLTNMAMPTAPLFAVLGGALIAVVWQTGDLNWSLGRKTTAAYAGGLTLIVLLGLHTSRSALWQAETARRVERGEQVNDAISDVLAETAMAQAHTCGYVITSDDRYLQSQQAAAGQCRAKLPALRQLIIDPAQQARSARLEAQVNELLQWFPQVIAAARTGSAATVRRDMVNHGEDLMDGVRALTAEMEAAELRLLQEHHRQAQDVARFTQVSITTGTLVSLIVFLSVLWGLNQSEKRQQQALATVRESNALNASLLQTMPLGMEIVDETGNILFQNAALEQAVGKPSLGQKCWLVYCDDQQPCAACPLKEPIKIGETKTIERAGVLGGRIFEITHTGMVYQGKPALLEIFHDITARKRAEESHARLAMAVEHAAETIMITDEHGVIVYANPAFEKTSGYTRAEALGQNPRLLKSGKHDAKFYRRMWATVVAGQTWSGNIINKRKDGTLYEEDASISPVLDAAGQIVNFVAVKRDVTEQKKLEAQARRTQRLESIGTLAGGIAHDLNNALAPIMMASELLRLEYPENTASRYLEMVQSSAKRGADMVKQLLTFAKGAEGERLPLQPRHLLKEMEKLINNTFLKSIELRTHYPKDLWTILGDATQLHQVLLNLSVNARDAMPGGGTLTLEAENQKLDAAYASTVPEAKPGRYVVWRVKDTGTGIAPEVLDHIFDPFYTTKGPDKGTGLGLSTTLGIVKGHGGFIRVYSTPGQGSTFAVYLPAYGAGASDTDLLTKTDTGFRGHGETILVVDDEDAVRTVLRAVLTKFNFKVLTAGDGADALIQVAEHPTELRAVITDLHMPQMNGLDFVRVLKGRLPQAGIIVASGRMEEADENEFKQLGVHAMIEKPFTQEKLVEALKTVFQK